MQLNFEQPVFSKNLFPGYASQYRHQQIPGNSTVKISHDQNSQRISSHINMHTGNIPHGSVFFTQQIPGNSTVKISHDRNSRRISSHINMHTGNIPHGSVFFTQIFT